MSTLERRGFGIFEGIFDHQECEVILKELGHSARVGVPGHRNLLRNRFVETVASDSRLTKIAELFLAGSAIPYKAILFDKSLDANWLVPWHQDRVLPVKQRSVNDEWGPWTQKDGINFAHAPAWAMERIVALRIHLDDSGEQNGPLRVVPGSHLIGVIDQNEVVNLAKGSDTVMCAVRKGGVIAMRPLLIHASSKSTSGKPRRVLHIEYVDELRLAEGIELCIS